MYPLSAQILSQLLDCLQRLNLLISKMRSQCYDGASNITGTKKGVAKQIPNVENWQYSYIAMVMC